MMKAFVCRNRVTITRTLDSCVQHVWISYMFIPQGSRLVEYAPEM